MVSVIKQKPNGERLTDEKDVQARFVGHAVMRFIGSQRISSWWNSTTRNNKCSDVFNAALLAILIGDFKEAERLRLKATFGFIKWPVIVSAIAAIYMSFIPFVWIAFVVFLLMLTRRFSWLLYAEAESLCKVLGVSMPRPDDQNWPFAFIPMNPEGGRYKRFMRDVKEKLPKCRFLEKAYSAFVAFRDAETTYVHLPVKNCVVCATMSAGKSTFINALLGMDVLPARNRATTARVTSVYDKDGACGLVGFVRKSSNEYTDVCDTVDTAMLGNWNGDENVSRIFLQGDLDGIANCGFKIVVHDTPGTDNSADRSHHSITLNFLREARADVVVYVANMEKLCTVEEHNLLKELFDVVHPHDAPVLFILNKADCIDSEKESLEEMIDEYRSFVSKIGFRNPIIRPVSSKAARLLKMALKGKVELLSSKEQHEFKGVVDEFTEWLSFDDIAHAVNSDETSDSIVVNESRYALSTLRTALVRTGIHRIECDLETLLSTSKTDKQENE